MDNEDVPTKIRIVGKENTYDYAQVKKSVVKIGSEFYLRTDPKLVWLKNGEGKRRAYRAESPLLVLDAETGEKMLKSQAILTSDNIWIRKDAAVYIDGKPFRKTHTVTLPDGTTVLKTDKALVKSRISGTWIRFDDAVQLSPKFYQKNAYISKAEAAPAVGNVVTTVAGHLMMKGDTVKRYDFETGGFKYYGPKETEGRSLNIATGFQDKTNPQEGRLEFVAAERSEIAKHCVFYSFNTPLEDLAKIGSEAELAELIGAEYEPRHGAFLIPRKLLPFFEEANEKYIQPRKVAEMTRVRDRMIKNFSDMDSNENLCKKFKIIREPLGGKIPVYSPSNGMRAIEGKQFGQTGGMRYSYGLEIETSNGAVPHDILEELNILCVGDRSIGAYEYVTPPMTGNAGIRRLEDLFEAISAHTLVDDRCSIHVHVGNLNTDMDKKQLNNPRGFVDFDRQFLINAVRLGCAVERELYQSLPESRSATLYHCHSIQRYKDIDSKNFSVFMGAYCKGPREWWLEPTNTCPEQLFDFEDYKLTGRDWRPGQWPDGRYKWLNLIPTLTGVPHKTIEYRIFSGTTTFFKAYHYLMTSLALTYVASNEPALIKPGLTLGDVFHAAYGKYGYTNLVTGLNDFYGERKAKFNRKKIYPKLDLPFLKGLE